METFSVLFVGWFMGMVCGVALYQWYMEKRVREELQKDGMKSIVKHWKNYLEYWDWFPVKHICTYRDPKNCPCPECIEVMYKNRK